MTVTSFSPSSISKISCPLIPSYFAKMGFAYFIVWMIWPHKDNGCYFAVQSEKAQAI